MGRGARKGELWAARKRSLGESKERSSAVVEKRKDGVNFLQRRVGGNRARSAYRGVPHWEASDTGPRMRAQFERRRPSLASSPRVPVLVHNSFVSWGDADRLASLTLSYAHSLVTCMFGEKNCKLLSRASAMPENLCSIVRVRVPRRRHLVQSRPRPFTAGERNSRQGGDLTMLVILKNLSGSNLTFGGDC
jgi:hypothetical protein